MRRPIALGVALWLAATGPALAAMAGEAFKDVPANHWAAQAIDEMAVKRSLMSVYPDDTFRGNQPFTRAQLADSLNSLVNELEALSHTTWKDGAPSDESLSDVAATDPDRPTILRMVNDYHLWRDVPGVSADHFGPEETVTRQEVAEVVRNLLSSGEADKAVLPRDPRDPRNPFKDLTPAEWAYKAILADDQRYRVMIGFPDVTFRPDTKLTRYQYAAIGAQTFGMIRDLVRQSAEEREALSPAEREDLFQGNRPVYFGYDGLVAPSLFKSSLTDQPDNLELRGIGYWPGGAFFMGQFQGGGLHSTGSASPTAGMALSLDGAWGNWNTPSWQIQPYIGARYTSLGQTIAVNPGLLFFHRFGPVGVDLLTDFDLGRSLDGTLNNAGAAELGPWNIGAAVEIPIHHNWAFHVGPTIALFAPMTDSNGVVLNAGLSWGP
ncbi:MAG: S-layer homology domain-containing protein [Cyanobacteria bacterium REEB65]|nr:S-layer homology domain-containing protein [Cyanobacteria bacterium REEB65]